MLTFGLVVDLRPSLACFTHDGGIDQGGQFLANEMSIHVMTYDKIAIFGVNQP